VRFGRDEARQQNAGDDAQKRVHYVRFGRVAGGDDAALDDDADQAGKADKRPNYVRFG